MKLQSIEFNALDMNVTQNNDTTPVTEWCHCFASNLDVTIIFSKLYLRITQSAVIPPMAVTAQIPTV